MGPGGGGRLKQQILPAQPGASSPVAFFSRTLDSPLWLPSEHVLLPQVALGGQLVLPGAPTLCTNVLGMRQGLLGGLQNFLSGPDGPPFRKP